MRRFEGSVLAVYGGACLFAREGVLELDDLFRGAGLNESARCTITIETTAEADAREEAVRHIADIAERYHAAAVAYTLDRTFRRGTELDCVGALLDRAIEALRAMWLAGKGGE